MSLDKVAKEILAEAEARASGIGGQADEEARQIMSEAKKNAAVQAEEIETHSQARLEELRRTELSAFRLEQNKRIITEKKRALEEIFSGAEKEISGLDSKKRADITVKLCRKGLLELPEAKFVYSNAKDREAASSVKGLKFKSTIDCLGGVVLENEDGSVRVNCTFEEIFAKVKEESLDAVAQRVLGKA